MDPLPAAVPFSPLTFFQVVTLLYLNLLVSFSLCFLQLLYLRCTRASFHMLVDDSQIESPGL